MALCDQYSICKSCTDVCIAGQDYCYHCSDERIVGLLGGKAANEIIELKRIQSKAKRFIEKGKITKSTSYKELRKKVKRSIYNRKYQVAQSKSTFSFENNKIALETVFYQIKTK